MSTIVTTVIAAASATAAVATAFLYLYFGRRDDLVAAREEALALAETGRQVIDDKRTASVTREARQTQEGKL
jgi:hypothetical protein